MPRVVVLGVLAILGVLVLVTAGPAGSAAAHGGKVKLEVAAAEGRCFYSSPGVLTPGHWTVVVTSTDTDVLRGESTVDARAAQTAPTQTTAPTPTTSAASSSGYRSDLEISDDGNGSGTWWTVAFAVALALTGVAVFMVRRRGRPGAATASRQTPGRPGSRSTPGTTGRARRHG
jgi:hypothetical protein